MSLSAPAKKRLIALHGWSATILSVLLYVVMLTGTVVVFDNEIRKWSEGSGDRISPFRYDISDLVDRFAVQVPDELTQTVSIGTGEDDLVRLIFAGPVETQNGRTETYARAFEVNARTGTVLKAVSGPRDELSFEPASHALERFLVELHVRLHVPGRWGLYLTGIAGVAMLISAITGVLIHRHILKELFVAGRPGNRVVSFRDRHNLAGVWSLPFAVLLAFTGAFLSFATSLGLPVVAMAAFGGDQQKAIEFILGPPAVAADQRVALVDLDRVLADAGARLGRDPSGVEITNYGRANAEIETFHIPPDGAVRGVTLRYSGADGTFIGRAQTVGSAPSLGNSLAELVAPLHFGTFAGYWSRIIWAALGAAMTYTIVSGLQLWLKRRGGDPGWSAGPRVMACVVWGLPLAMVGSAWGYFLTLLSGDPRAGTVAGFLAVAGCVILLTLLWSTRPVDWVSARLCGGLALLLALLPLLRLQTGGMSWGEALVFGGRDILFIDTLCLLGGALLFWTARRYGAQAGPTREVANPAE